MDTRPPRLPLPYGEILFIYMYKCLFSSFLSLYGGGGSPLPLPGKHMGGVWGGGGLEPGGGARTPGFHAGRTHLKQVWPSPPPPPL